MAELRRRYAVYIVDDDHAVRDALSLLLSLRGYRTASFGCAEDFLGALREDWAGCVIADLRMPGLSGLELQAELVRRGRRIPVVIITAHGDVASARTAFKTEAIDFLEKPFDDDQLVAAIDTAFAREHARIEAVERVALRSARMAVLSAREREVMALLVTGMQNLEIGARLGISPRTVEIHKARVLAKLGARNVAELVRLAE